MSIFQAMDNCLGDVGLEDGICPEFKCIGPSSCNSRGNCSSLKKTCDCNPGFSGFDCSVDLEGKKSYIYIKLYM